MFFPTFRKFSAHISLNVFSMSHFLLFAFWNIHNVNIACLMMSISLEGCLCSFLLLLLFYLIISKAQKFFLLPSQFCWCSLFCFNLMYLLEGELEGQGGREEERESESTCTPRSAGSLFNCLQWWAGTGIQEHHPGLPWGWQEPNYLSHHLCLPGRYSCLGRKLELGAGARSQTQGLWCGIQAS